MVYFMLIHKYCVQTHFIVPRVNIFRYIIDIIIIILTTGHIWLKIQVFSVDAKTRLMKYFHRVLFQYLQLMIRKIRIYCIFQAYKMHTIHKRSIQGFNSMQFDWHVHLYINAFWRQLAVYFSQSRELWSVLRGQSVNIIMYSSLYHIHNIY